MTGGFADRLRTPTDSDLAIRLARNEAGLEIGLLSNGALFAIEHHAGDRRIMINQVLGSGIGGGLGRIYLRIGGPDPAVFAIAGSGARDEAGCDGDRIAWQGETGGVHHRVTLWLHPARTLWLWRIEVTNRGEAPLACDALLMQDIGLGDRGFLTNNEAFACQYLDHHVAMAPNAGAVIMTRQNLAQSGAHPWVAHGCLDEAVGFATDFRQFLGPRYRDGAAFDLPFGTSLPSGRLQGECAGAALRSSPRSIAAGDCASWTFFGVYRPDHPGASGDSDLSLIEEVRLASRDFAPRSIPLTKTVRSVVEDAPPLETAPMTTGELEERYPERTHVEAEGGQVLSFFVPEDGCNRHIVVGEKERLVARRHGAILSTGRSWLPADDALCLTCWMHGIFGAQLTIGNTSLHKLFSVSRDPYNIVRSSGLRILVDTGDGWRLLTTPSVFEIGLQDCRWIYRSGDRAVTVSAVAAGDAAAAQWRLSVDGDPCRFLVVGHLVLGERELAQAGSVEIDGSRTRVTFRPAEGQIWDQHYPQAVFHLVTSTPRCVDAIGSDELLYADQVRRQGDFVVIRTRATNELSFAVVGSLTSEDAAEALAERYSLGVDDATMRAAIAPFWREATRNLRLDHSAGDDTAGAMSTILPWLVHNGRVHLAVPHGLEQYTGAAWGTRDVCQGPVEMLLSLQHDEPVREILRTLFAQQDEAGGDWPQWFMLEPYSFIRDSGAHGDVIIWPLKALCDYLEETGDLAVLDEPIGWRRKGGVEASARISSLTDHVERLLATVESQFLPGTHLIRYGNGDWNDSLQPADPAKRDWMVSSWTVALLYQQLGRYAAILERAGQPGKARDHAALATRIRDDFQRYLVRDDTVAGYAVLNPEGSEPELLLHPADRTTGVSYSLISFTQALIADLLTPEQEQRHLSLLREHLLFPDGTRLMDRPVLYNGGIERLFRRAESSAFFGREIGLMYVHAHLRYAEVLAAHGDGAGLWEALALVNPISVTERVANASLRQRNAYFSSSDAAFADRYQASAEWARVRNGTIPVDAGWRIYSSGPGLYINMLIRHALGVRRSFGKPVTAPCLPPALSGLRLRWDTAHDRGHPA
jgi:cellobiose phosphorylase